MQFRTSLNQINLLAIFFNHQVEKYVMNVTLKPIPLSPSGTTIDFYRVKPRVKQDGKNLGSKTKNLGPA